MGVHTWFLRGDDIAPRGTLETVSLLRLGGRCRHPAGRDQGQHLIPYKAQDGPYNRGSPAPNASGEEAETLVCECVKT